MIEQLTEMAVARSDGELIVDDVADTQGPPVVFLFEQPGNLVILVGFLPIFGGY